MKTIRTTITFPEDLHQQLRVKAIKSKKSLSQVLVEHLMSTNKFEVNTTKNKSNKSLPFGIFSPTEISEKEIDEITESWEKTVNELT